MNAEVDQRTAARASLSGEPAALAGDTAAAYPSAASAVDFAALAVGDVLLEELRVGVVTVVAHTHKELAVLFGSVLHLLLLGSVDSVGLLAEYVDAVLESIYGDNGVHIVRSCNIDNIELLLLDHLLVVNIYLDTLILDVRALDVLVALLGLDITHCDNVGAGVLSPGIGVYVTHTAETDDTYSESFHNENILSYTAIELPFYIITGDCARI